MCEGVCYKCREKLQWRFQYNKYKPLKNVANCQGCKKKCVAKAYRTLCDHCAADRKVCSGCCRSMAEMDEEKRKRDEYLGLAQSDDIPEGSMELEKAQQPPVVVEPADHDDDDDDDTESMGDGGVQPGDKRGIEEVLSPNISAGVIQDWDQRRFDDIVNTKYSKNRVTGSQVDQIIRGLPTSEPVLSVFNIPALPESPLVEESFNPTTKTEDGQEDK
jgi:hypothetical protein